MDSIGDELLRQELWFHGPMTREEAEKRLVIASLQNTEGSLGGGTYLVRESTSLSGQYCLSIYCWDHFLHCLVHRDPITRGYYILESTTYQTISDMVIALRKRKNLQGLVGDGFNRPITLSYPCMRPEAMGTESNQSKRENAYSNTPRIGVTNDSGEGPSSGFQPLPAGTPCPSRTPPARPTSTNGNSDTPENGQSSSPQSGSGAWGDYKWAARKPRSGSITVPEVSVSPGEGARKSSASPLMRTISDPSRSPSMQRQIDTEIPEGGGFREIDRSHGWSQRRRAIRMHSHGQGTEKDPNGGPDESHPSNQWENSLFSAVKSPSSIKDVQTNSLPAAMDRLSLKAGGGDMTRRRSPTFSGSSTANQDPRPPMQAHSPQPQRATRSLFSLGRTPNSKSDSVLDSLRQTPPARPPKSPMTGYRDKGKESIYDAPGYMDGPAMPQHLISLLGPTTPNMVAVPTPIPPPGTCRCVACMHKMKTSGDVPTLPFQQRQNEQFLAFVHESLRLGHLNNDTALLLLRIHEEHRHRTPDLSDPDMVPVQKIAEILGWARSERAPVTPVVPPKFTRMASNVTTPDLDNISMMTDTDIREWNGDENTVQARVKALTDMLKPFLRMLGPRGKANNEVEMEDREPLMQMDEGVAKVGAAMC